MIKLYPKSLTIITLTVVVACFLAGMATENLINNTTEPVCSQWIVKERIIYNEQVSKNEFKEQYKYKIQCKDYAKIVKAGTKVFPISSKIAKEWIKK